MKKQFYKNLGLFIVYGAIFSALRNLSNSAKLREILPEIPAVHLDYGVRSPYNESKVALLIETRPMGILAPLMIHFISVLPPDWKFRFMGTQESITKVKNSAAIRQQIKRGKLDLTYLPKNISVAGQEEISSFFTNYWIMQRVLQPAEWLLVYQTDSIVCGKNRDTIDDYLQYDWVGAPWWDGSKYGGNGGLSLRRVSSMVQILEHQQRENFTEPEDVWLTERLGHLPESRTANGTESMKFSVESIWYDEPMGYHTGGSGAWIAPSVYGRPEQRQHIWDYCPEMKMTLDMDTSMHVLHVCSEIF